MKKYLGYNFYFFDFFGTIMLRKCSDDDIKKIWSNKVSKYLFALISSKELYKIRKGAELALAGKENREFTYKELINDIYYRINCFIGGRLECTQDFFFEICYKSEVESELERQELNTPIIELAKELKEIGKKIYILSDFYLGKKEITLFLEEKGVKNLFEDIYVSCEYGENKLNGGIYRKILNQLKIIPSECCMIGDNYRSDIKNAKAAMVQAIQVKVPRNHNRREEWTKILNDLRVRQKKAGMSYANYAFSLFYFISKLYDELNRRNFNKVFFFAREGELLKQLFDLYCVTLNKDFGLPIIESHYLYVSRQSTYAAGLKELNEEDFASLFKEYRDMSVLAFLSNLTFEEGQIKKIQKSLDLDFYKTIVNFKNSDEYQQLRGSKLFADYYDNNVKQRRSTLIKYLSQNGFYEDSQVAVVDIGWKGSIQDNIYRTKEDISLFGFYYGLTNLATVTEKNIKSGLIFHEYPLRSKDYVTWSFDCNFLERLCTASHASTKGYQEESGKMTPVFNEYGEEEDNYKLIKPIQDGILKVFSRIIGIIYKLPCLSDDLEECIMTIHNKTRCKINKSNMILQYKLLSKQKENFGYQSAAGSRLETLYKGSNLKKYYRALKDPIKVARLLASKKFFTLSAWLYRVQYGKLIKK